MRSRPPPSDDFGEDEDTVIDGTPLLEEHGEYDTPRTIPRCRDCGNVVFFDAFSFPASQIASNMFSARQCVTSRDGHFRWCATIKQAVFKFPQQT